MTALALIGLLSAFLIVLTVLSWFVGWLLGPDPDLGPEPWDPRDATFRFPPCGERGCKVDHDAVRPWRERVR